MEDNFSEQNILAQHFFRKPYDELTRNEQEVVDNKLAAQKEDSHEEDEGRTGYRPEREGYLGDKR